MSNPTKKICPECGNTNPGNWIACANCGAALPSSTSPTSTGATGSSTVRQPQRSTVRPSTSQTPRPTPYTPAPAPATSYQGQDESGWSRGFDQAWGFGCGCISFIFVILILLLWIGSPFSTGSSSSDGSSGGDSTVAVSSGVTLGQYNRLYAGMSYREAAAVLDSPGVESSRNEVGGYVTVAYTWQNEDGSNIIVMFQNDQLVQKTQAGLQ